MKALTICQPYAHLIVRGEKRVENREWYMRHRGLLLIHAGKSRAWLDDHDIPAFQAAGDPMAFGAIVGIANVIDCIHIDDVERADIMREYPWLPDHEHTNGTWCIVLHNVRRFNVPIPCKGAQGLWQYCGALPPEAY